MEVKNTLLNIEKGATDQQAPDGNKGERNYVRNFYTFRKKTQEGYQQLHVRRLCDRSSGFLS